MSNFITRKKIQDLSKNVLGEPFNVEEWGGCVYIKAWTGQERADFISKVQSIYSETDKPDVHGLFNFQTEVIALSLYGEDGEPLYDITNTSDIKEVKAIEANLLQKLFEECATRNGLVDNRIVTDIKNSETTQS